MNSFYIELLSAFLLFLTALTCLFSIFKENGVYWIMPFIASSLLTGQRLMQLFSSEKEFLPVYGSDLYRSLITPAGLLALFISSLLLRYGIKRSSAVSLSEISTSIRNTLQLQRTDELERYFTDQIHRSQPVPVPLSSRFWYITGIKHSGKSSSGRTAAQELGFRFFDLDDLILSFCKDSPLSDKSIREIYSLVGKEHFMLLELITLKHFINEYERRYPHSEVIIATGGGVCDNGPILEVLKATGTILYLESPEDVLFERISAGGIPPFLDTHHPRESFHELYLERDAAYSEQADEIIHLQSDHDVQQVSKMIVSSIIQHKEI